MYGLKPVPFKAIGILQEALWKLFLKSRFRPRAFHRLRSIKHDRFLSRRTFL